MRSDRVVMLPPGFNQNLGQLELDALVEQYLTRWHLPSSNYDTSGVTIRRLLSHSAGLSVHGYPGLHPDVQHPSLEESLSGNNGGAGEVRIFMEPGTQFIGLVKSNSSQAQEKKADRLIQILRMVLRESLRSLFPVIQRDGYSVRM